jgi:hypothetical protein
VSNTIETTNGVGTELDFDVKVPVALTTGQVQAYLTALSRNVSHVSVASQSLIGFPAGQFRTVRLTIPSTLRTQLAGNVTDLRVDIVLNVPAPSRTYLVDNIQLGVTSPPFTDDLTTATRVMGFESAADWTGSGTTVSTAATHSAGAGAISFPGNGGTFTVTSRVVRTLTSSGGHVSFDVKLPAQPSSGFMGTIQLFVTAPSVGLNNAAVGSVNFAPPVNQFSTITMTVPSNVVSALAQAFDDLRFTFQVTVPAGTTGTYTLDNLRFAP